MQRLIIVTGASRGIGAAIALEANKTFSQNTLFLLIARDQAKLDEVKSEIIKNELNNCLTMSIDFGKVVKTAELADKLRLALSTVDLKDLNELYVFYNHGTMKIGKVENVADDSLAEFQINVSSVWVLIASIKSLFPLSLIQKQFHVNLSSLWASTIQDSVSVYSATRCARATLFRCLALEQPSLRVLNYQPGPVYTDMLKQIHDSALMQEFSSMYEQGKFLSAEQTVKRLWGILQKDVFETGSTIDYFDPEI